MSKPTVKERPRHPQNVRIDAALAEDAERVKAQKGLITKRSTLVTAGMSGDAMQKIVGETMRPTDEQLDRINAFTRRPVTADEVVAFTTLSCNDIIDRDDDQFTKGCVKDFASLEQPFSPVGKSFMLDHDYEVGKQVGRIFGVGTQTIDGATFLTNEVYIPNTAKNEGLIEDIDFGVSWAVSVGVMLGAQECSVCGSGFSSWGYWCQEGHDKGYFYDPKSEETDNWGYPIPCEPDTKGAVKCWRKFTEPRDFYELSQVFLGAQYYAALSEKVPDLAGTLKAAAPGSFIGASGEEADQLPLRHEPKKVSEARSKGFELKEEEDGSLTWRDEEDLVYSFDPQDPEAEVLCLGKATTTKSEEDADGGHPLPDSQFGAEDDGDEDEAVSVEEVDGDEEEASVNDADDESEVSEEENDSDEDEDNEEEKAMSKADVLKAVKAAELDGKFVKAVEEADGDGLSALLLALAADNKELREEKGNLSERAALGDAYLKELRADAIDWYVKSHATGDGGVSTERFEKMLDRVGDDSEILRDIIEENKALAQTKFPDKVRRSSFPTDVAREDEARKAQDEPIYQAENDSRVRKIHG